MTPGTVERPKVVYLVDTSQSMALGQKSTRWEQVLAHDPRRRAAARRANRRAGQCFPVRQPTGCGRRHPRGARRGPRNRSGVVRARPGPTSRRPPTRRRWPPSTPTHSWSVRSRALAGRFGQVAPQAVVVFSDGRARDPARAESIARGYRTDEGADPRRPCGRSGRRRRRGDRQHGRAPTGPQALAGRGAALRAKLSATRGNASSSSSASYRPAGSTTAGPILGRTPLVLQDGVMSANLAFDSGEEDRHIEARIDPLPGEVSTTNNVFAADIAIDHTKIRVLYLEGTRRPLRRAVPPADAHPGQRRGSRGLLAPAGRLDGRPRHRMHGRIAGRRRGRFRLAPAQSTSLGADCRKARRSGLPTMRSS